MMARTQPETRLQQQIRKALMKRWPGAVIYKMHGSEFMESGIPDLIGCVAGMYVAIEVKHPGTSHSVTTIQQAQLDRITRAGGLAVAVESVEDALMAVEGWLLTHD